MAIYHFSAQVISRSKGQSAVASASYRSGERLEDERTGETKYYARKVQPETMILSPSHAPDWVQDRNRLWNEVEKSETRKNSQLAREFNVALPRELSNEQQTELIKNYVQTEFVNKGMIADIAIHRDDKDNPHAHVMLTTREISEEGFTVKNRDWNDRALLNQWREQWSAHANKSLEKAGIQERISHLSHEARGMEQLPTVHLGHVAAAMEKEGKNSDRGNINRDRQEYNALVIDLQKYREEKKALEAEKARQQAKQQKDAFHTPLDRLHLQQAEKFLKAEPSFPRIKERQDQLDKWDERLNKNDKFIWWKDRAIKETSDHFKWISNFNEKIQKSERKIENINWLNPLKLKENRMIKERAQQDISHAEKQIKFHDEKLNYHREKLGFTSEDEFNQVKQQHEEHRPDLIRKNHKERERISEERDILQKAEKAIQNGYIRRVASLYPERPEMPYMDFKTALRLAELSKKNGGPVPIEFIERRLNDRKQDIQKLQDNIQHIENHRSRLQRAEGYLNNYEKHQAIVEKYENNPFLKGKMFVSKTAKQEYDNAVAALNNYESHLKKENVSGRTDLKNQVDRQRKMEPKIPEFKAQIESHGKSLGIFESIINGIEQANREMTRERNQQQRKMKSKSKSKQRHRSQQQQELEL